MGQQKGRAYISNSSRIEEKCSTEKVIVSLDEVRGTDNGCLSVFDVISFNSQKAIKGEMYSNFSV